MTIEEILIKDNINIYKDWLIDNGRQEEADNIKDKEINTFADLKDTYIVAIENKDKEELIFTLSNGNKYKLYHEQECCEVVLIEDINGDLNDLLFSPILISEESVVEDDTFYKIATIKGHVIIRWMGDIDSYYSSYVSFCKI